MGELVFDRLVGLADKLIGLLIELMLLIAYIREKQGANQDKSRIGLAKWSPRHAAQAPALRVADPNEKNEYEIPSSYTPQGPTPPA